VVANLTMASPAAFSRVISKWSIIGATTTRQKTSKCNTNRGGKPCSSIKADLKLSVLCILQRFELDPAKSGARAAPRKFFAIGFYGPACFSAISPTNGSLNISC
jgi:hypothetical protein